MSRSTRPALLAKQILKARRGTIWIASVCDPYQPLEKRYALTRKSLEILAGRDFPVQIQTKSALVRRDLDVIRTIAAVEVGFTVATEDENMAGLFEPRASPVGERIEIAEGIQGGRGADVCLCRAAPARESRTIGRPPGRGRGPGPHRPDELCVLR